MAALELHCFEPNMLNNSEMIALKIVKWIIAKKIDLVDLVKVPSQTLTFPPCRQFRVGRNDVTKTRLGCQDSFKMEASAGRFFRDECKSWMLTCYKRILKKASFLEWPSPSITKASW